MIVVSDEEEHYNQHKTRTKQASHDPYRIEIQRYLNLLPCFIDSYFHQIYGNRTAQVSVITPGKGRFSHLGFEFTKIKRKTMNTGAFFIIPTKLQSSDDDQYKLNLTEKENNSNIPYLNVIQNYTGGPIQKGLLCHYFLKRFYKCEGCFEMTIVTRGFRGLVDLENEFRRIEKKVMTFGAFLVFPVIAMQK